MSSWYLDTSAALKLIVGEAESHALIDAINGEAPTLVSSRLLETEMRRAVNRLTGLTQRHVAGVLDRVDLYDLPPGTFTQAGMLPGVDLRSLDALHLASAINIGVDAVVTYDLRLAEAAMDAGLVVRSPGPG